MSLITTDLVKQDGRIKVKRPTKPNPHTNGRSTDELKRRQRQADLEYGRGKAIRVRSIKDKKLRAKLKSLEDRRKEATLKAKDAEILLEHNSGLLEAEHELERTYRVRQDEIKDSVGLETAKKGFELKLTDFGPYVFDYSRNGRDLLLAGKKGHVATMDWRSGRLACELQLGQTVRDAKWLHNNQFFAVAQKQSVYIYDHSGLEIHNLEKHTEPKHLEFLPYHFLLASIGMSGRINWQDTSTGKIVAEANTKQGTPTTMTQNPYNAVIHVGHQNGTVSLWSPTTGTPLVKMLCHKGPVRSLAMDREGRYMVSTGQDSKMSVWDIRSFKPVHEYVLRRPGSTLSISDRNLTAVGSGTQTTIWKDLFIRHHSDVEQQKVKLHYMSWGGEGKTIERVRWCPFEDVLGVGHDEGFSSLIVPGAGEPNFDALEINPYETPKQRREAEVKSLLTKLQPEMISLNPSFVGKLDTASNQQKQAERDLDRKTGAEAEREKIEQLSKKGRGKNSSLKRYLRKKGGKNIIDEHKMRAIELRDQQREKRQQQANDEAAELGPALARFVGKV